LEKTRERSCEAGLTAKSRKTKMEKPTLSTPRKEREGKGIRGGPVKRERENYSSVINWNSFREGCLVGKKKGWRKTPLMDRRGSFTPLAGLGMEA